MPQDTDEMHSKELKVYRDGKMTETTSAIDTVLQAANIDTEGLVVPDPADLDLIEDDVEAAMIADRGFRALHMATGRAWIVMGEYAAVVHKRKLYTKLASPVTGMPFGSFKEWCQDATNKGRTTVYGEMTLVRELGIPRNDLMRISKANAWTLLKVKRRGGASKVTPELIELAATMDDTKFQRHCVQFMPGAAADEVEYTIKAKVPDSVGKLWEETVEMMQVLFQTNDWEIIIERMIVATRDAEFSNETGALASLEGMSNWEAFNRMREVLEANGTKIKRSGKPMVGTRVTKAPAAPPEPDAFTQNIDAVVDGEAVAIEDDLDELTASLTTDDIDGTLESLDMDDDGDDNWGGGGWGVATDDDAL